MGEELELWLDGSKIGFRRRYQARGATVGRSSYCKQFRGWNEAEAQIGGGPTRFFTRSIVHPLAAAPRILTMKDYIDESLISNLAGVSRIPRCFHLSSVDHEKFQKGRLWAYVAGIGIFAVVALWKFIAR